MRKPRRYCRLGKSQVTLWTSVTSTLKWGQYYKEYLLSENSYITSISILQTLKTCIFLLLCLHRLFIPSPSAPLRVSADPAFRLSIRPVCHLVTQMVTAGQQPPVRRVGSSLCALTCFGGTIVLLQLSQTPFSRPHET